jgi:hypothetical protein
MLPATWPLMTSAPATLTVPKSSGAWSLLDRPVALRAAQPLMLDPFLLDGEAAPLIVDQPDWMKL